MSTVSLSYWAAGHQAFLRLEYKYNQQMFEYLSKVITNEQPRHHQNRRGTVRLDQVTEHEIAHDCSQPGGHQCDGHGGGPEVGGEQLYAQAVQAVEPHGRDRAEHAGENQVHGGAVHEVDEEGGTATEQH